MYKNLEKTLSLNGIECKEPYYISLDSTAFDFPQETLPIDFYAFCICTDGEIEIEIDNTEYLISKNNFLISIPTSTIRFRTSSPDFKMKVLFFEKNFLLKNLSNPFIIEKTVMLEHNTYSIVQGDNETTEFLNNILIYLDSKTKEKGKFSDEIIRTIIINLILEVAEITHSNLSKYLGDNPTISDVYLQFKNLVAEHILEDKSVQFYSKKLNISNKYLIEIVKKSSKKTPHEVINEMLIKEAYVLLGNTTLSISQIAYKLHFNSVSAFGRFFKKHTKLSPSNYRLKENLIH